MEILRFVRCDSFPEAMCLVGCIVDEVDPKTSSAPSNHQGQAVIWEVPATNAEPIARILTAAEARQVQRRYMIQQKELTELIANAKRGERVDEGVVREIMSRDIFAGTSAGTVILQDIY